MSPADITDEAVAAAYRCVWPGTAMRHDRFVDLKAGIAAALSARPQPPQQPVAVRDDRQFAVVSSDFAHPFLLGAYSTLEKAVKAQGGSPDKWHIFERYAASLARPVADSDEFDEAYAIGKRDGYEEAIQDLDVATGGDGEFKGSSFTGETVDVPVMRARIIERFAQPVAEEPL